MKAPGGGGSDSVEIRVEEVEMENNLDECLPTSHDHWLWCLIWGPIVEVKELEVAGWMIIETGSR